MPYFHSNVMLSSFVAPLIQLWECLVQGQPCVDLWQFLYGSLHASWGQSLDFSVGSG